MRAIHLNYHEVTEDPRVMKECTALANRGIEVTVVCALHPGHPEHERIGSLNIYRIPWMDRSKLSVEFIDQISEFPKSEALVRDRLRPLVPIKGEAKHCVVKHIQNANFELHPDAAYRQFRGLKRLAAKASYRRKMSGLLKEIKKDLKRKNLQRAFKTQKQLHREVLGRESSTGSCAAAKHNDVYQASAFLFDLNLQSIDFSGSYDIVHAHDIYTLVAGVRLSSALKAKLIYDAHEYEVERASKMPPEGNELADAIERDCLERTDALITVSNGICELYAKRFSKRFPTLVMNAPEIISRPPDSETLAALRVAFRYKLGLAQETPLLVFTGLVLGEQRGLAQVVVALSILKEFHLVILGPRQEAKDAKLMEIAKIVNAQDRIHLLEPVPHNEVVPTIRACDVAVIPFQDSGLSYRYALPNKLFEGVFSGLPVAVSDLPDMKAFVEELGRGLAMDSKDPKNIADTITLLYNDRASYQIDEEAFDELAEKYSWSAQEQRLYELYTSLASE